MDILAARKKAAELARIKAEQNAEPAAQPAVPPVGEPGRPTPPANAEAAPIEPEAPADVPAAEESAIDAATSPDSVLEQPQIPEIEMLSFRLGEEEYALTIDDVKEVLKNRELTPLPNAPDYILGVTALRGPVLPVIDLCRRLGIPPGVRDQKSRILVVNLHDEDAGIIVDRVTGVVRIHPDSIRPVPETIEHGAEFLRGIARKEDKLYILLDTEKALGA